MAKANATQSSADKLHQTTDRAAEAAHRAVDTGAEYSEAAEQRVREQGDRAARQWHDSQERMAAKGREWDREVVSYMTEHPYASLGMAVGAGALLGAILRKR